MKKKYLKRTITSKRNSRPGSLILILTIIILLSACGGQDARSTPEYFIPPTVAVPPATATPEVTATPTPEPTDETPCTNDLRFISDVTFPDDTVVAPGEEINKVWLVQNSGTCNWEADYSIRNTGGPPMGSSTIVALYPVRSGGDYEIAIDFVAPTDGGQHISRWQAHDPEGAPFGQEIFIQIFVNPDLVSSED
jgi:hypothetical protein